MQKWSSMSKSHLIKLIYRGVLFLSALIYFIVMLATKRASYGESVLFVSFGQGIPVFLIIMTLIFVPEMAMRFFPNAHEALGTQKMYKSNFVPTKDENAKPIKMHWSRTLMVFGAWALLNGIFGTLNVFGILSDDIMVLLCLAYSVCDLICIMFFCPFQKLMMQNKCCQTCRIYNWDYPMMFTPFLFLILKPGPILHYIMLGFALVVLLIWEITYKLHPERFSEVTNECLSCKSCQEKLCRHNKNYPHKKAIKDLLEHKKTKTANKN